MDSKCFGRRLGAEKSWLRFLARCGLTNYSISSNSFGVIHFTESPLSLQLRQLMGPTARLKSRVVRLIAWIKKNARRKATWSFIRFCTCQPRVRVTLVIILVTETSFKNLGCNMRGCGFGLPISTFDMFLTMRYASFLCVCIILHKKLYVKPMFPPL